MGSRLSGGAVWDRVTNLDWALRFSQVHSAGLLGTCRLATARANTILTQASSSMARCVRVTGRMCRGWLYSKASGNTSTPIFGQSTDLRVSSSSNFPQLLMHISASRLDCPLCAAVCVRERPWFYQNLRVMS